MIYNNRSFSKHSNKGEARAIDKEIRPNPNSLGAALRFALYAVNLYECTVYQAFARMRGANAKQGLKRFIRGVNEFKEENFCFPRGEKRCYAINTHADDVAIPERLGKEYV